LIVVLGLLLGVVPALAQAPVQQSSTRLDAATFVSTSASSAATITITPPAGQYVYLTGIDLTNCAGASAVTAAAPTTVTTTNLSGAAWTVGSGSTAGNCQASPTGMSYPLTLKSSTAGTAVTIVLPTFATNQTIRVSAYYYFGL
jgi:hypothetical protein